MNFLMRSQNWTSWRRMAQAGDWNFRPIQCLGDFGTMGFAKQALFLAEEFPQVSFCQFANDAKHGPPVRFTMEILVPKVPMERIHVQGLGLIGTSISWLETHQIFVTWSKHMVFDVFVCLPRSGLSSLPFKKAFTGAREFGNPIHDVGATMLHMSPF